MKKPKKTTLMNSPKGKRYGAECACGFSAESATREGSLLLANQHLMETTGLAHRVYTRGE